MDLLGTSASDLRTLAQTLLAAERRPINLLEARKAQTRSTIEAYSSLASKLSSLRTSARSYASPGSLSPFQSATISSSRPEVVDATVSTGAALVPHTVVVEALAAQHVLASAGLGENLVTEDTDISFQLALGDRTVDVSVGLDGEASLQEQLQTIARAIRESGSGIDAYILETGDEHKLVLQSRNQGTDARVVGITDLEGDVMGRLGMAGVEGADGVHPATTQAASDARFFLDGIEVVRSSNSVSGVLPGITLELKAVSSEPVTIGITRDLGGIREELDAFIKLYNESLDQVRSQTRASDGEGSGRGALAGQPLVSRLRTYLRTAVTNPVLGLEGPFNALSDLGVTADRGGHLRVSDPAALDAALGEDVDAVVALFNSEGGVAGRLVSLLDRYAASDGILSAQEGTARERIQRFDRQIDSLEETLARREQTLLDRLASFQEAIGLLTSQQNFLGLFR